MRRLLFSLFLLVLSLTLLNCGNQGNVKSLTITPTTADAQNHSNGQVQFTATSILINGRKVTPANALWTSNPPWTLTPAAAIFVNGEGLTTCANVGPGLYPVYATAPIDPNVPIAKMTMKTPQVTAAASLSCP